MSQTLEELKAAVIAELPPEDRLRGLSPEEILLALSEDDRKRLIDLAQRQPPEKGSS